MSPDRASLVNAQAVLFGRRLAEERSAGCLSLGQLALRTGFAPDYISLVEEGRTDPTIEAMADLAEAVGANIWDLLIPAR